MKTNSMKYKISLLVIVSIFIVTTVAVLFVVKGINDISKEYRKDYETTVINKRKEELSHYTYLANMILKSFYENSTIDKMMLEVEKDMKKEAVHAIEMLQKEYDKSKNTSNEKELIAKMGDILKGIKFGDNNYFWLIKLDGTVTMHPINVELEGNNIINEKDSNGKYFLKELIEKVKANDSAIVGYKWLKPDTSTVEDKISYAMLFKPLNLVVVTGRYIDDMQKQIKANALEVIKNSKYGSDGYFFVTDMNGKMIMHTNSALIGKDSFSFVDANGKRFIGDNAQNIKTKGEYFVDYTWQKPNETKSTDKITHFRVFPEWGYIVATGTYIDDLQLEITNMKKESAEHIKDIIIEIIIVISIIITCILAVVLFIMSNIIKPIMMSVEAITVSSKEVFTTASAISMSAHDLATSSASQSSSVEEVSATIVEYTASIKSNADNLIEANRLSNQSHKIAVDGFGEIKALTVSMEAINTSSASIANIIKTIDEIAFQTNLLALNAAVEAARAGEHGLGFAVVAEEVRSLASRSAGAAKETTNIIEQSIQDVQHVNTIANNTNESFSKILQSSKELNTLIEEIASTAKEQSIGLTQISSAMSAIDFSTQTVASSSEELASSATQLSAIAKDMQDNTVQVHFSINGD